MRRADDWIYGNERCAPSTSGDDTTRGRHEGICIVSMSPSGEDASTSHSGSHTPRESKPVRSVSYRLLTALVYRPPPPLGCYTVLQLALLTVALCAEALKAYHDLTGHFARYRGRLLAFDAFMELSSVTVQRCNLAASVVLLAYWSRNGLFRHYDTHGGGGTQSFNGRLCLCTALLLGLELPWVIADVYHLVDTVSRGHFDIANEQHYLLLAGIASEWLYLLPMVACPIVFAEAVAQVHGAAVALTRGIRSAAEELRRQIGGRPAGGQTIHWSSGQVCRFVRSLIAVERRVLRANAAFGCYLLVSFVTLPPQANVDIHRMLMGARGPAIASQRGILWKKLLGVAQNAIVPTMLIAVASALADQMEEIRSAAMGYISARLQWATTHMHGHAATADFYAPMQLLAELANHQTCITVCGVLGLTRRFFFTVISLSVTYQVVMLRMERASPSSGLNATTAAAAGTTAAALHDWALL